MTARHESSCIAAAQWGSEEDIIRAARQSTEGTFRGWNQDEKLLRYMWRNKHTSPFEFCGGVVECEAPLFVFGQIVRHRTFALNVFSQRYSHVRDDYFEPTEWRSQGTSNKQCSGGPVDDQGHVHFVYRRAIEDAFTAYEDLLALGVSREQARMVLPLSTFTKWRMAGSLLNWTKLLRLRLASDVQPETRDWARGAHGVVSAWFPKTLAMFDEEMAE